MVITRLGSKTNFLQGKKIRTMKKYNECHFSLLTSRVQGDRLTVVIPLKANLLI